MKLSHPSDQAGVTEMDCAKIIFSGHSIRRMFERAIQKQHVIEAVRFGSVLDEYPDDEPFPSFLLLGPVRTRPLHVVVAVEARSKTCYIVTAYVPDPEVWEDDLTTRRSR